jgi:N,N'-diacetyllegionaminate synthase
MDIQDGVPYIIGETAYNHEGDSDYLLKMIDDISDLGLNAVKFHMLLNPESYMQKTHPLFDTLQKWLFSPEEWDKIIGYTRKKGLDIIMLCDDVESLNHVKCRPVSAVEVHATSLNDFFILTEAAQFPGCVILGIGGSTLDEIQYAVDFLNMKRKEDILLMYGFQSYPTDYRNVNLSRMLKIRELFSLPVGYADHTAYNDPCNEIISIAAAMMGINVLEKHYTPDYGTERIDYQAAVGKQQMARIKELMSVALTVYGGGLLMSQPELDYGNTGPMKKAIVARRKIKKGEKLSLDNVWFKRTEKESCIRQNQFLQLIGCEVTKDLQKDDIIDFDSIKYRFKGIHLRNYTEE